MQDNECARIIKSARNRLLKMHFDSKCGHIGGNLSCIDAMIVLHHYIMKSDDRFILSKGHSAGALYVTLWTLGKLQDSDLNTFCKDNTRLPGHPSGVGVPDLLFSTGSLGHGPSLAAGLALALKYKNSRSQIYCLCSDGEWQEGSCWEALSFAVHHRLENLTIIIDQNGLQGFGHTKEVISCDDLSPRIAAFGACVRRADGHDPAAIATALAQRGPGVPVVLVLDTIKGRGLHFENRLESHYLPLTDAQYLDAKSFLDQGGTS